ncbi:MAG: hypothetical protein GXP37_02845 [Chloroflexi bacterium]|nr:hypothetical protein [Chloroflexota bacterium]
MKRNQTNTLLWGILMLLLGIAGLLYNFGVLDPYLTMTAYTVAILLALAGVGFLAAILLQRQRWAFAIPGFSLLSLAGVVYLATLGTVAPQWLGVLFVGGVVLGFLVLFLSDRTQRWWALLQAGFIASMGAVGWATVNMMVPDTDRFSAFRLGALLFGGFAASFLLLYLFAGARRRFQWALVMTGVLGAFALLMLGEGLGGKESSFVKLWPLLLILLGAYLLSRLITGRTRTPSKAPVVPAEALEAPAAGGTAVSSPEPARIVRSETSGSSQPSAHPSPAPEPSAVLPALAPEPAVEPPLPADLQDMPLEDAGAALDALLDASQKATEGEPDS